MKLAKECLKNKQVYHWLVHACSVSLADTQVVLYHWLIRNEVKD